MECIANVLQPEWRRHDALKPTVANGGPGRLRPRISRGSEPPKGERMRVTVPVDMDGIALLVIEHDAFTDC